ncbi:calnexin isoform X2 [Linepithema humile]|uniref:calnexin isoform X2 n=1 Tax=Linepithema humile TaxID=83485 RepID=UPI0006239CB6|nr:PREDICTED: calnexin isoform X1 [Linepithema humile]XP_012215993.1 PREDICTED: calnexin isoform X1 [Linepithema humile]XP_012215994.1 PREDICTED: calnexin isoform X1 [Linepithema humile]XP_012215995.1 PREDICTED: calnexin isoform X1 [Linepithema humile]
MARIIACVILITFLSVCFNILNANGKHDEDFSDEIQEPPYKSPEPSGFVYLAENFDDEEKFKNTWVLSEAKKENIDEDIAKFDGIWAIEELDKFAMSGDLGLVLKSKARHAAISTLLAKPFYFEDKPLIVQYEVNFQQGQECGGAYLKLLTLDDNYGDLKQFHDKTPYTIMFGPDICGKDHKLHFIFRHKNPLNGTVSEKHCKKSKDSLEDYFQDKIPHLYTLIIRPDNSYQIKIDNKFVSAGSLLDDFIPPINPPLEIEDPEDKQPEDWDDREKIPDPLAEKPEDWDEDAPAQIVDETDIMPEGWLEDEPPTIPNPDSVKPDDWDVEMDGEWEAPEIPNPKCAEAPGCGPYKQKMKKNPRYKGKWLPPLVNNPNYKGKWKPRLVHNPDYFNDENPFKMLPISAIGFELWSMSPNIYFDNIIIADDVEVAKKWADDSFEIRRAKIAEETRSLWQRIVIFTANHPWIWAVYIILCAIPAVTIMYFCCLRESETDFNEEEERSPFGISSEIREKENAENENQESLNPELATQESAIDLEDAEKETATEEVIDIDKEDKEDKNASLISEEGPRRRKPNKE